MNARQNEFQVWVSFFLLANGAKGEIVEFFNKLHIACSYSTLQKRIDEQSTEQRATTKQKVGVVQTNKQTKQNKTKKK